MTLIAPRSPGNAALGRSAGPREFPHIGLLNDYLAVPYATGSSFASQFLQAQFKIRGHQVTVVGPSDPTARPEDLPQPSVAIPSLPMRSNPGFRLPVPTPAAMRRLKDERFDVIVGQTSSALMDAGAYVRATQGVPLICVNTAMLSSLYDVLLPESIAENTRVQELCHRYIVPFVEQASVRVYNNSDGLIVLSKGLESYWRELGVTVPIHVIPRTVNPRICAAELGSDPYPATAPKGFRLLVLCRQVREKGIARLIDIFARYVAPRIPEATLTLVGDGPDLPSFQTRCKRLKIADRVFFPGEVAVTEAPTWYQHADLFMYASLSETYGQVISEAMYCGLPVVAMDDDAGVAQQINTGRDGVLLPPGPDIETSNERFGHEVVDLLERPLRRRALAEAARRSAENRADPDRIIQRYYTAFEQARRHRALCQPSTSTYSLTSPLVKWAVMHTTVSGFGMLRAPTSRIDNRPRQPGWGDRQPEQRTAKPNRRSASA